MYIHIRFVKDFRFMIDWIRFTFMSNPRLSCTYDIHREVELLSTYKKRKCRDIPKVTSFQPKESNQSIKKRCVMVIK